MAAPHPSPTTSGRALRPLTLLLLALAVLAGVVGCRALTATAAPPDAAPVTVRPVTLPTTDEPVRIDPSPRSPEGTSGGRLPDGTTASDDRYPGVARLDDDLLRALREASADAAADGVTITLNSGWRSRAYQEHLLDEAVERYGSRTEAARWVATPATSPHVSGDAVDVDGAEAAGWLAEHGRAYGLCRVYANEPWHVELRPRAVEHGCPGLYADPTHDPRMHP
jgi:zinc D-Ala-D-Ala carboxypeptidase